MKRIYLATILLAAILATASCNRQKPTDSHTSGLATIVCDESFANIVEQEIDVFEYTYPQASIVSYYVDETSAIDSLKVGATSLIVASHELPADLTNYLNSHDRRVHSQKIAVDAIAVIANNKNPIEELSLAELRDILLGKVTDWNEISPNKSGKITIVFDQTLWGALFSGAGCLALFAVNFIFIPKIGYMACAWAGVAGYGIAMLLSYFVGQKKYPIAYPLKDIAIYVIAAAVIYCGMLLTSKYLGTIPQIAVNCVLIALFCALIVKRDLPLSDLPVIGKHFRKSC